MHFLGTIDILFVVLYLVIIAGVSIWSIRKKRGTPSEYFLANRNLGWWVIGASILASNVGSEHIVGLAGTGATSGLVMGHYECIRGWYWYWGGYLFPFICEAWFIQCRSFLKGDLMQNRGGCSLLFNS